MDFDEDVADQLIAACDEAAAALRGQRGPRASVTGEALEEFRGSFANLFRQNSQSQSAARNFLIGALEDLTRQVRFAKAQADQARQDLENQQAKALWHLIDDGFVTAGADYVRSRIPGLSPLEGLSGSDVRRPEVVFPPIVLEPHHWATSGGSGTSSAVPGALKKAASLIFEQEDSSEAVCQNVVHALNRFQDSCSWALINVGTFAPAALQFNQDDRDDAGKLWQIGEAFQTAGSDADLGTPIELSAISLALAISPDEVHGDALLKFFATASSLDLEVASKNPAWLTHLPSLSSERIASWWAGLHGPGSNATAGHAAQQRLLLEGAPEVFGALDGIPSLDRVYANKLAARESIAVAESALSRLREVAPGDPLANQTEARQAVLVKEISYLKHVESGDVQLYLYDHKNSRIVEMIGTPEHDTKRTITYIPGTFTSPESFYDGGVQQFSRYMVRWAPGTVAFVYKDGLFPGENQAEGGEDFLRLAEANDPQLGLDAGRQLSSFQQGVQSDPLLQRTEQIGIGHSWGYQNLTSSEIFGAEYDKSISLSGAGMHEQWMPDANTRYSNFVYKSDVLLWAQKTGQVWNGKVPSTHDSFINHEYVAPNRGSILPDSSPIEDHSLPTTDSQDNTELLEDALREVAR